MGGEFKANQDANSDRTVVSKPWVKENIPGLFPTSLNGVVRGCFVERETVLFQFNLYICL